MTIWHQQKRWVFFFQFRTPSGHMCARNQPHTHSHTLSLYKKRWFAGRYIRWNGQDTIRLPGTGSRPRETTAGLSCLPFSCLLLSGAAANCHGPGFAAHSIEKDVDNAWTRTTIMGYGGVFVGGNQGWWDRDGVRGGRERQGLFATNRGALGRQDALVHRIQLRVQRVSIVSLRG